MQPCGTEGGKEGKGEGADRGEEGGKLLWVEGSIRGPCGPKKNSQFLSEAPLENPLACLLIALTQGFTVRCCVSLLLKLKL